MFIIITFLATLLFVSCGVVLLRPLLRHTDQRLTIFCAWALMAGVTGYIFMIFGLLKCLNSTSAILWMISMVVIALAGRKQVQMALSVKGRSSDDNIFRIDIGIRILVLIIFSYLIISFLGALAPPANLDVMNYHFALVKQCLKSEALVFNPTFFYGATPFSAEMLSSFVILLSDYRGGQLIQFMAGMFLIFSIYFGARQLLGGRKAVLAISIFLSTLFLPAILSEAKNDQLLSLFSFLSIHYLALASEDSDNKSLLVGAMLGGLAAGMKTYGLAIPIIGFAQIIFGRLSNRNALSAKSIALSILAAALIACPWYLRSLILTGNPFHPFVSQLFTDSYWNSTLSYKFELLREWRYVEASLTQFVLSPFRITFDPDSYLARLGPIFLSLLPIVFLFRIKNPILKFHGIAALTYYIIWFAILRDTRYLLPILPGTALLLAEPLGQLYQKGRWPKLIITCILAMNLLMASVINFRIQYQKIPAALGIIGDEDFYKNLEEVDRTKLSEGEYTKAIPEFGFLQKVNSIVGDNNGIGLFSYDEPFIYYFINSRIYLLLPLWQNAFDFQKMANEDDLEIQLEALSINYLITDIGDDKCVPSNEIMSRFPEFESTLNGANIFIDYLNNRCDLVISDGRYRCFKRR